MSPDRGVQRERTRLAWRRTTLTVTAVAILATRLALQGGGALAGLAVAAVIAGWLGTLVVSWRRIVALATPGTVPVRRAIPLTTGTAIGFAGLGAVLVVAGR
jgi:hypothetical protein